MFLAANTNYHYCPTLKKIIYVLQVQRNISSQFEHCIYFNLLFIMAELCTYQSVKSLNRLCKITALRYAVSDAFSPTKISMLLILILLFCFLYRLKKPSVESFILPPEGIKYIRNCTAVLRLNCHKHNVRNKLNLSVQQNMQAPKTNKTLQYSIRE